MPSKRFLSSLPATPEEYWEWLKEGMSLLTAPLVDTHNHHMEIYADRGGEGLVLTDNGYTLLDLELRGLNVDDHPIHRTVLEEILHRYGVRRRKGELLVVLGDGSEFLVKGHALVQAILAVEDAFFPIQIRVPGSFARDVKDWLVFHGVRFVPSVKVQGRSGFDHYFDLIVPASQAQPERVIKVINRPDWNQAFSLAIAWADIERAGFARLYAILNDRPGRAPEEEGIKLLQERGIEVVLWSRKEDFLRDLRG